MNKSKLLLLCFVSLTFLWNNTYSQWNAKTLSNIDIIKGCDFYDANNGVIVGCYNCLGDPSQGRILKTTNGGITFNVVENIDDAKFEDVYFVNSNVGYACGSLGVKGLIGKTNDGGNTWDTTLFEGYDFLQAVYFINEDTGFLVGDHIYKTTDGGNNWNEVFFLDYSIRFYDVCFADTLVGYAVTGGPLSTTGKIYKTFDGGETWTNIPMSYYNSGYSAVYCLDEQNVIVSTSKSGIIKSTDGGITWNSQYFPSSITFTDLSFTNHIIGYACGYSTGTMYVYQTTDAGTTWTANYTTSGLNLYCIKAYNNTVVTGGFGVYAQNDNIGNTLKYKSTAYISGSNIICPSDTTKLTFYFTGKAPWSVTYSDGTTNTQLNNINDSPYIIDVTTNKNTNYSISSFKDADSASTYYSGIARITLSAPPTATFSQSDTICLGESAKITLNLTGKYPWVIKYSDGIIDSTISNILYSKTTIDVTPVKTTIYSLVQVSDKCFNGTVNGNVVIAVSRIPTSQAAFSIYPPNTAKCYGDSVLLVANVEDSVYYKWSYGNPGDNLKTLPMYKSFWVNKNIYGSRFILTSVCNNYKDTINIVIIKKDHTLIHFDTNYYCDGNPVKAISIIKGKYKWSTGDTTQSISINGSGFYSIKVMDSMNCSLSDTISIKRPGFVNNIKSLTDSILCPDEANATLSLNIPFTKDFITLNNDYAPKSCLNDNVIFALNTSGRIMRSVNGGWNWEKILDLSCVDFQFINDSIGFALKYVSYDNRYEVRRTTNSGNSWEIVFDTVINNYHEAFSVYFINKTLGFIFCGDSTLLRTTDLGITWTQIKLNNYPSSTSFCQEIIRFINDSVGVIAGMSGSYFKTTDRGLTWEKNTLYGSTYNIFSVNLVSDSLWYALAGTYSQKYLIRTKNAGDSWDQIYSYSFTGYLSKVLFLNKDTGYTQMAGSLYISEDGGHTWRSLFTGGSDFIITPNKTIYIRDVKMKKSNNMKVQWYYNNNAVDTAIGFQFKTNNTGIYKAYIKDGDCASTTLNYYLAAGIKPIADIIGDSMGCPNTDIQLKAPEGYTNYEWQEISHGYYSTSSYMLKTKLEGNSIFKLTVTNKDNCTDTISKTVLARTLPNTTIKTICDTLYVEGKEGFSYDWVSGPVQYSWTNECVAILPGIYYVVINDGFCTAQSMPVYHSMADKTCSGAKKNNSSDIISSVSFFPNPATDFINIISNDEELLHVEILDMSSHKLIERNIIEEEINIQSLAPGIYMLKVNGVVFKLIKQ